MRMLLGLVVTWWILVGCTSDTEPDPEPAASPDRTPAVDSLPAGHPLEGLPVLTITLECYGPECVAREPPGMPSVAVLDDGTVVTADFGSGQPRELELRSGSVDRSTVADLEELAEAAGLGGGGLLPELRLPRGVGIEDGGGSVFARREGTDVTVRDVPHLDDRADYNRSGERGEYLALQQAMLALDAPEPLSWSREALLVQRVEDLPAGEAVPWPGPDFRNRLVDTALGQCTLVDALGPLTASSTFQPYFEIAGESWKVVRRPLLPYEDTCADIDAMALRGSADRRSRGPSGPAPKAPRAENTAFLFGCGAAEARLGFLSAEPLKRSDG